MTSWEVFWGERKNAVSGGRSGCKSKDWEIVIRIGRDGSPGKSKFENLIWFQE
jgi:hypothetical protein